MYNRGRLGILVKTGRLGGRESRTYMNFEELGLPAPLIAGLAAQGLSPEAAAVCGVWLHGAAADVCAARHSMQGMLPEDILQGLCAVFLENGR